MTLGAGLGLPLLSVIKATPLANHLYAELPEFILYDEGQ